MATVGDRLHSRVMKFAARHETPIQEVLEALWLNARSTTDNYVLAEAIEECPTAAELTEQGLTGMSLPEYVSEAILDNTLPAIRETWRRLSWTLDAKRRVQQGWENDSPALKYGTRYTERVILEGLVIVDAYSRLGHARGVNTLIGKR